MTCGATSVLVLADDLTGLAEIAGLTAERGVRGVVFTSPGAFIGRVEPVSALVFVNLACRTSVGADARQTLVDVITSVGAIRPPRVYLKLDSVARGPIASLLQGLLKTLNVRHVPLLLANPSQRRATRDGTLYVDGTRLDASPFRTDPVHPTREAFLPAILTAGLDLHVTLGGTASDGTVADGGRGVIHVLDGGSKTDVAAHGNAWKSTTVAAGAAPFGVELICQWLGNRPRCAEPRQPMNFQRALVVVGTRHPAGSALADEFQQLGGNLCRTSTPPTSPRLPLLIQPPAVPADPGAVLAALTATAARIYEASRPRTLFLVGGETAQSLTNILHIRRAVPLGYACRTALLRFTRQDRTAPVQLLVKPGSYGQPHLVAQLFSLAKPDRLPGC